MTRRNLSNISLGRLAISSKYYRRQRRGGIQAVRQHKDEIAILITDQRMPGEKGVQLLEKSPPASSSRYSDAGDGLFGSRSGDFRREHRRDLQIRPQTMGCAAT